MKAVDLSNVSNSFALDVHGIDQLKLRAKNAPDQAMRGIAQQFEALLLSSMLKSMRDATPSDGPLDSEQSNMYTSFLDQQLAQKLSSGKGIGLADMLVRQLGGASAALPQVPQALTPGAVKGSDKTGAVQGGLNSSVATPKAFVERLWPHATEAAQKLGVPPHFLVGHAALESGWGQREIRAADGSSSHNLFGIKADAKWKGAVVEVPTTEYVNGVPHQTVGRFRAYASYDEAFKDYSSLLHDSPRYSWMFQNGLDAKGFASGLQQSGYATDPLYAGKLSRIIDGQNMRQALAI